MHRANRTVAAFLILAAVGNADRARADVRLPAIFGSHMVVQREKPIDVWGWANPKEAVTVQFDSKTEKTTADANGNWRVSFSARKADGQPHRIVVTGTNTIVLEDVLIGEVWIGSGQSNMEWPVSHTENAEQAIAEANLPNIRLFQVPKLQADRPAQNLEATWVAASPETVKNFSAVLYYFGKKLQGELNVPIGLINSSWGGSPIEPWLADGTGKMFNAMVAPFVSFAIKGTLWYQGESNVGDGLKYADKMKSLIEGWRKAFDQKHMAFLFVQIAPLQGYQEGALPFLWEAQTAALKLPATGMVVTTDLVDNIKDIHPRNKRDVGNRLALWAMYMAYGKNDVAFSGPIYKSMKVAGNKIKISFAHVAEGLRTRDVGPLTEFEIAGEDGVFVPAQATIDGKSVVVFSSKVAAPKHVRFAWRNDPNPNLINSAGLPAAPFQTKNWQGGTGECEAGCSN